MDICLLARITKLRRYEMEYEVIHPFQGRLMFDPERDKREQDMRTRFLFSHTFGSEHEILGNLLNKKIMFYKKPQDPEKDLKTYAEEIVDVYLPGLFQEL